jgi:hypothetical protein
MASEKTPLTANDDTLLDALTKAAWHVEDAARKFSPQDLSRKTFGDRKVRRRMPCARFMERC